MRLLLMRHAQTPSNARGLLDTSVPGPGLTDLGHRQADAVPRALEEQDIAGVFVSPIRRTTLTATPLMTERGLEAGMLDGLREIEAGSLELSGEEDAVRTYVQTAYSWGAGDLAARIPGAPGDGAAFFSRYDDAIARIAESGLPSALVVSHGAAIRTWASARVHGLDPLEIAQTPLANTGLFELEGDAVSGWELVRVTFTPIGGQFLIPHDGPDPTSDALDEVPEPRS